MLWFGIYQTVQRCCLSALSNVKMYSLLLFVEISVTRIVYLDMLLMEAYCVLYEVLTECMYIEVFFNTGLSRTVHCRVVGDVLCMAGTYLIKKHTV